jgi:hypothetical protein
MKVEEDSLHNANLWVKKGVKRLINAVNKLSLIFSKKLNKVKLF